jgi:hypothetical protein
VTVSLNDGGGSDVRLRNASAELHAGDSPLGVPCVYCRSGIPAAKFAFWSDAKRLLSADCPACERRVTLAASTWRRWLRSLSTTPSSSEG